MPAFRISINGKPFCETETIASLTLVTELVRRRDQERITLHASTGDGEKVQWLTAAFEVGDEIQIRVVDESEIVDSAPSGCDFCGRTIHELENLVRGTHVSVCNHCIVSFVAFVKGGARLPLGASVRDDKNLSCGFCGNRPDEVPGLIVQNGAAICAECLRACSDITA